MARRRHLFIPGDLHDDPRFIVAGLDAVGVWLLCATWSLNHRTEGFVPEPVVAYIARSRVTRARAVAALVEQGLWQPVDDGWRITGWNALRGEYRTNIRPAIRRAVYERDDWTCQVCGLRIAPTTDQHHSGHRAPVADDGTLLTLDHRRPYSDGGADTEENLRALCGPCNVARGTRPLDEVTA